MAVFRRTVPGKTVSFYRPNDFYRFYRGIYLKTKTAEAVFIIFCFLLFLCLAFYLRELFGFFDYFAAFDDKLLVTRSS